MRVCARVWCVLVVAAALVAGACAVPLQRVAAHRHYWREHVQQRREQQQQQEQAPHTLLTAAASPVVTRWFTAQRVDHFALAGTPHAQATWAQRFYVNAQFFNGSGPVFLYVEGEAAAKPKRLTTGLCFETARAHGALLFSLEHRFYGLSQPTGNLSTESLQFLSHYQAIEDVATFIHFVKHNYSLAASHPVITFGGSYPGMMSAWVRVEHPELVAGAIASSAPVRAQLDWPGYNDLVTRALLNPIIGGSQECALKVKEMFTIIDDLLNSTAGRLQLSAQFNACSPIASDLDAWEFGASMTSLFQGYVQYNNYTHSDVGKTCQLVLSPAYVNDPLRALMTMISDESGPGICTGGSGECDVVAKCFDYSYENDVAQLRNITVDETKMVRQWYYQTCTEFGFFQTCEGATCYLSHWNFFAPYIQICHDVYGLPAHRLHYEAQVALTNLRTGADHPPGSNIFFSNGDMDAWHLLSVQHARPFNIQASVINGTSHCYDLYAEERIVGGPASLFSTRAAERAAVNTYLQIAAALPHP